MSATTLARLVSRCRGLSAAVAAAPDAELLGRFVRSRDADAFTELVGRYAGLVWGVCRRTLPQEADAEDAFQATFVALARGARRIDARRPLAGWLHAVSLRVSRRALGRTLRRRTVDLPADCTGTADVVHDVGARDLFRAIDEEIERLPAALRAPVVLCCLEGRARDEAAELLGCSVPAVKSRLERARQALRHALSRRGIPLPAAFFVLGLGASSVGAQVKAAAVRAAMGSASPAVTRLAAAAVSFSGIVSHLAIVLVTVVAVCVGVFGLPQSPKDAPPTTKETPAAPPTPKPRLDRFGDPLPHGAVRRFGTLRFRHESVAALAFTPDGRRLVAGIGRDPLAVFDAVDGRKLREVGEISANNNYGFALSPDGKHVFCTGYRLTMFDLETGAKTRTFEAVRCSSVSVSPDGKRVAAAREHSGGQAMVFDVATGKKLVDLNLKDIPATQWGPDVRNLAFSPDGERVAGVVHEIKEVQPGQFIASGSRLRLWEAATGNAVGNVGPADDPPFSFAFLPGTRSLAHIGNRPAIRIWDTEAAKETRTIAFAKGDSAAADLAVSADGKCAAVYFRSGAVAVYDVASGRELRRVQAGGESFTPVAVALSADGSQVACGKMYGDSSVRVFDVGTGKERLADAGHRGPATLSMSADGKTLISCGNGQVFDWDLKTGEGKAKPDDRKDADGYVPGSDFSRMKYRTPRYLFTLDTTTGHIEVHTRDGSRLIAKAACPKEYHRGHAFSPDGKQLAVSFQDRGYTVLLWAPEARDDPLRLSGHPDACQTMAFTHDGKYLIAGCGTHNMYKTETIFVYDTATGKLVRKLATNSAPGKMLVTRDDRTLITGGRWNDGTARAWDLASSNELATMVDPAVKNPSVAQPGGGATASIGGLALSNDERFLAVLTGDGVLSSVSVWDTGSWKLVRSFAPARPRSDAASIAFARDGQSVFVAYLDSTILEWDVSGRFGKMSPAPTAARLDELWQDLADPAGKGYSAVWELLEHPADGVALIRSKLAPAGPPDTRTIRDLVGKLGSDVFREREDAAKRLATFGETALPFLREAASGKLSAEGKERVEKVIAALTGDLTADQLRARRAVAFLEWSGRADAGAHLRKLAGGDPAARLTAEARAALLRRERGAGFAD